MRVLLPFSRDGADWDLILMLHRFLDLMTEFPTTFFVPTLDIDLAWHSHQLQGKQYTVDMTSHNT
jgi:hypothetical protein